MSSSGSNCPLLSLETRLRLLLLISRIILSDFVGAGALVLGAAGAAFSASELSRLLFIFTKRPSRFPMKDRFGLSGSIVIEMALVSLGSRQVKRVCLLL